MLYTPEEIASHAALLSFLFVIGVCFLAFAFRPLPPRLTTRQVAGRVGEWTLTILLISVCAALTAAFWAYLLARVVL